MVCKNILTFIILIYDLIAFNVVYHLKILYIKLLSNTFTHMQDHSNNFFMF